MADIQELARRVDELSSNEAIRECIYRVDRGIDRLDVNILRTAFHPDAKVQWLTPAPVPLSEWLQNSARYLDKFSRRDGQWKIDSRIKMMDWARIMEGSDPIFDGAALKGRRDAEDLSYSTVRRQRIPLA